MPSFLCCSSRDIFMSRSIVWYRIRPTLWSSCPSWKQQRGQKLQVALLFCIVVFYCHSCPNSSAKASDSLMPAAQTLATTAFQIQPEAWAPAAQNTEEAGGAPGSRRSAAAGRWSAARIAG